MKRLTIVYLLLTFLSLYSYDSYSSYSHFDTTEQVNLHLGNNQKFSNKNSVKNVLGAFIAQATPIAVPFIMLGKFIVGRIKNKRNKKTQHNVSDQSHIPIKKQELVYYPIVETTFPEKPINLPCQKKLEQLLNQLCNVYNIPERGRRPSTRHSQRLLQRISALKQSLNTNLQCSLYKSNWSDVDPAFIQEFNVDSSSIDLNGTKIQYVLQKEFHDIAQETALAWMRHRNNAYVQQLVEKNVTCIKKGIAHNQAGKIIEATRFADIGWAILDHIQALGEGVVQGAGNVVHAFVHPIDTVQGITQAIYTATDYLRQATLEVVDLCILRVTDQNAADKKLQAWKQNFTELMDTVHEQWEETENRDITKFVSSFITEIFLTGKVSHGLGSFFSFARINSAKLIQKAQKTTKLVAQVTTPEGIITRVNKAVKHTQHTSKTGPTISIASQIQPIIKKNN